MIETSKSKFLLCQQATSQQHHQQSKKWRLKICEDGRDDHYQQSRSVLIQRWKRAIGQQSHLCCEAFDVPNPSHKTGKDSQVNETFEIVTNHAAKGTSIAI